MATGTLRISTFVADEALPVANATIMVYAAGQTQTQPPLAQLVTNTEGLSGAVTLQAPDAAISQRPYDGVLPYSVYDIVVQKTDFQRVVIEGIQIFAGQEALAQVEMSPVQPSLPETDVNEVPRHHLADPSQDETRYFKEFETTPFFQTAPAVRAEEPTATFSRKPRVCGTNDFSGGRILDQVVIPQNITVHLGRPSVAAQNVTVPFRDYIKNVCCSEIYPTWPENALRANIYCQISLALNRIWTEWYPSRGYNFDITNSTQYDQYYVHNRDIFTNISNIVDEIFDIYIRKADNNEPYYAEYCDGQIAQCPGLKQWGTVSLANQGYSPLQILRYYYGNDVSLVQAPQIQGNPRSYPGYVLREGSSGEPVRILQLQLNRIRKNYPSIPLVHVDGQFGPATRAAVVRFQEIFRLATDGIAGKATWYQISYIYVSVTKLAELTSEGSSLYVNPIDYPGSPLRIGDTGAAVSEMQKWLRGVGQFYDALAPIGPPDGIFGPETDNAVRQFQRLFNLTVDGLVGPSTWNELLQAYQRVEPEIIAGGNNPVAYPGTPLRMGDRGEAVRTLQRYLNTIGIMYGAIPRLSEDGIFGSGTDSAVRIYQCNFNLTIDGIVGPETWSNIADVMQSL